VTDELEITREAYEQLRRKLTGWYQEQYRLQAQMKREAKDPGTLSPDLLRLQAQLEEVAARISQLEARLARGVRILRDSGGHPHEQADA